jgi:hypothetical protein
MAVRRAIASVDIVTGTTVQFGTTAGAALVEARQRRLSSSARRGVAGELHRRAARGFIIMSTKAEAAASAAAKKGPSPKRRKKLAQRKKVKSARTPETETSAQRKRHRVKPDTQIVLAAERAVSSPKARAMRARTRET